MLKLHIFNYKGFSLLELMISLVVMITAFMGILPFFFYAQKSIKEALLTQYALTFIEEKMERIKTLDYDLIDYRDFSDLASEGLAYIYILPEVNGGMCADHGPCGFNVDGTNTLRDIVSSPGSGYFFERHIDIDDSEDDESWEPGETPLNINLPPATKRISIRVSWSVPGVDKHRFVTASTERSRLSID